MLESWLHSTICYTKIPRNSHIHIGMTNIYSPELAAGCPRKGSFFKHPTVIVHEVDDRSCSLVKFHPVFILVIMQAIFVSPWQRLVSRSAIMVDGDVITQFSKLPQHFRSRQRIEES